MIYDIIIIGGGPAGLTAANNTAHRGLKTLVLETRPEAGGQPRFFYPKKVIIDHPGFPDGVSGEELSRRLHEQAVNSGAEIHTDEEALALIPRINWKIIETNRGQYRGKKIILCTGMLNIPKKLPILEKYHGEGVEHFVKDPEKFRDMDVLIIGGGDSALDNAVMVSHTAKSVTVMDIGPKLKAKESTVEIAKSSKVKFLLHSELKDIETKNEKISSATIYNQKTQETVTLNPDKIVVSIGYVSPKEFFDSMNIRRYSDGTIVVNDRMETSIEGIYAAGDIVGEVKLIAVACAEGIVAAVNTFNSIKKPYWLNPSHKHK